MAILVVTSGIISAQSAGDYDPSFDMSIGADGGITAILPLPDGRILVGGDFLNIQGQSISYLARLNADGSIDNTFNTGSGPSGSVRKILPYSPGKFAICGWFSMYDGQARNGIAVINADGSLDATFTFVTGLTALAIDAMAVQMDGKIVVGGEITAPQSGFARINANGTLDIPFVNGSGLVASGSMGVTDIHIQSDGKLILVGNFHECDGNAVGRIVRLNQDGSYDGTFNAGVGADGTIMSITPTSDGKLVLTGEFGLYDGVVSVGLVIVSDDGTYTGPFVANGGFGGPGMMVRDCHIQPDGKVWVVGEFDSYGLTPTTNITRLNSDLSIDQNFSPNAAFPLGGARVISRQWDGRYVVGGFFTSYYVHTSNRLVRIYGDSCFSRVMGTVTLDGQPVSAGKVYVYTEQLQGVGYSIADSTDIIDGDYTFDNLAEFPVTYILQAVPDPQTYPANVALPTFFSPEGPSHEWNDPALTYSLNSTCGNIDTINITLLEPEAGTVSPGTGTISGQLRWADSKMATEDPIPIIDIVVERVPPGNSAFAYTQTDEQGNYTFTDLPLTAGEDFVYGIHVSIPGIPMQNTYLVSITEQGQTFTDLDFLCDTLENIIFPVGNINVGMDGPDGTELSIYPIPVHDRLTLNLPTEVQGMVSIEVFDLSGRNVLKRRMQAAPALNLSGLQLTPATYVLRLADDNGWQAMRQFMVVD